MAWAHAQRLTKRVLRPRQTRLSAQTGSFASIVGMSDREVIIRYLLAAMLAGAFTVAVIFIYWTYRL
jgi:hypothetical protein